MCEYRKETVDKIIRMFYPCTSEFLDFQKEEVICGPNDRAVFGFDTNFPLQWLVEDFGFTQEEAEWFIRKVQELHADDKGE